MEIPEKLQDYIEEVVAKIKADKDIANKFQKDPIGTVENLLNVDLPNEQLKVLAEAVKAKVNMDTLEDMLGGLGKLFGK